MVGSTNFNLSLGMDLSSYDEDSKEQKDLAKSIVIAENYAKNAIIKNNPKNQGISQIWFAKDKIALIPITEADQIRSVLFTHIKGIVPVDIICSYSDYLPSILRLFKEMVEKPPLVIQIWHLNDLIKSTTDFQLACGLFEAAKKCGHSVYDSEPYFYLFSANKIIKDLNDVPVSLMQEFRNNRYRSENWNWNIVARKLISINEENKNTEQLCKLLKILGKNVKLEKDGSYTDNGWIPPHSNR